MALQTSAAAENGNADCNTNISRPVAKFHPSHWAEYPLDYTSSDEFAQVQMEQEVKELKEEVKKELLANAESRLIEIDIVDKLERLGVAYHFEQEIEEALQLMYEIYDCYKHHDDLYYTSIRFRILRQHGFNVSSDIFKRFKDEGGSFMLALTRDIKGMLSLYQASYLRVHGDDILDEALSFTATHLRSMVTHLNHPLSAEVAHALEQPLHKGEQRLEFRHYIRVYELDPSHNTTLLKFAKLIYSLLQSIYKRELRDLNRWWKNLDFVTKLPYARDRLVDNHFWSTGAYYEPCYSYGRVTLTKLLQLVTVIDDTYDAYGTIEELQLFTEAMQRWDENCINQLPDYMKIFYQALLDNFNEFEQDLDKEGRSSCVRLAREEIQTICRYYLQEALWLNDKYLPAYDEYMRIATVSIGTPVGVVSSYIGLGPIANEEAFRWVSHCPKAARAGGYVVRLLDDMGGYKFEQERNHVSSAVQCYVRQHNVSEEKACEELRKQVEDAWRDLNEEMLHPTPVPMPLLKPILNLTRVVDVVYKGEDSYTNVSKRMKNNISMVLFDPLPV